MASRDDDFRVRPGRGRQNGRGARPKNFIALVLKAARKAGPAVPYSAGGARSPNFGHSSFGRGRAAFGRARLFSPQRRVVVKARVVRQRGRTFRSAPLTAHLAYLKREGVSRDEDKGRMFDATGDRADDTAFAERCRDDRHHFRFIVSPEDGGEMTDLRAFTRDLVRRMESDLDTRLDWVAADHWNTDNPHVHLLVRGVDGTGADLVIARDYISRGLRARAEELVSLELGPKPERAIRSALEREVDADRWTRLDVAIRSQADETGFVDLRPDGADDAESRRLMIGRLQKLERMGLATAAGSGRWVVGLETEPTLCELGMRGDIIKTLHRAFSERGEDRGPGDYILESEDTATPIIGRLVDKGLHNELTGEAYAVIDGIDGRAHHVRFQGIEAFDGAPPPGGIVEVRRLGGGESRKPTLILANRSDLDLAAQVTASGATWLDHRLVEREPTPLGMGGFGAEVRSALSARTEHLITEGLARRENQRVLFRRDLLATLRQRELDETARRITGESGLPHIKAEAGDSVAGLYRQRLTLASGRFAMIDDGLGFRLVPWSREIDKKLGRHITGVVKDSGGIDWSLGRKRGLGL